MISDADTGSSRELAPVDLREAEWQFDVADARAVERWFDEGDLRGGLSVGAGEVLRLADTYLDTADWRLYRAGFALRIRKRGKRTEATMKSLASGSNTPGLKNRREISEPLEDDRLAAVLEASGPVGERVRALVGSRSLEPLFEVRTRRVAYALSAEDGRVGEASVDETGIPTAGDENPVNIRRVEVETEPDGLPGLQPFVEELGASFELSPGASSKFQSGLMARELTPPGPPEFGPTGVDASLTLGEVAFAVMREQFVKMLTHEAGTRLGEDPEELHDMRVASRRLRAAIQIFEDALSVKARRMKNDIKHFAGVLGEVRDLDVQLEQLGGWISDSPSQDREHLGGLASALEKRRAEARERMLAELDSERYESFVEEFGAMLRRGPSRRTRGASVPVLAAAPDLVRRRYHKVRKRGDKVSKESPAEDYHELRKRGKRLRYALEFLADVYGKPAVKLVGRLRDLQDVLGDHQDAVVAVEQLRALSEDGDLAPRTVFAMGRIAHRYETGAWKLRARFPKAYGRIQGKRWRKLEKEMEKMRPADAASGQE